MICGLKGKVEEISGNLVALNVHDVVYEVLVSASSLAQMEPGAEANMVVYTDVKEDSIRLYGFADGMERQVFLLLLKVSGIGAKSASDILSRIDKSELLRAIGCGDVGKLQGIRGIGKKTAERLVVELKDKLAEFTLERNVSNFVVEKEVVGPFQEAMAALQALGFNKRDAERAVGEVERLGLAVEGASGEIVKQALRFV